jgi:hypothetical protein
MRYNQWQLRLCIFGLFFLVTSFAYSQSCSMPSGVPNAPTFYPWGNRHVFPTVDTNANDTINGPYFAILKNNTRDEGETDVIGTNGDCGGGQNDPCLLSAWTPSFSSYKTNTLTHNGMTVTRHQFTIGPDLKVTWVIPNSTTCPTVTETVVISPATTGTPFSDQQNSYLLSDGYWDVLPEAQWYNRCVAEAMISTPHGFHPFFETIDRLFILAKALRSSSNTIFSPPTKVYMRGGSYGAAVAIVSAYIDTKLYASAPKFDGFYAEGGPFSVRDYLRSNTFLRVVKEGLGRPGYFPRHVGDQGLLQAIFNDAFSGTDKSIENFDFRNIDPVRPFVLVLGTVDSGITGGANFRFKTLSEWFTPLSGSPNRENLKLFYDEAGHGDIALDLNRYARVGDFLNLARGTIPSPNPVAIPTPTKEIFLSDLDAVIDEPRAAAVVTTTPGITRTFTTMVPSEVQEHRALLLHQPTGGGNYQFFYGDTSGFINVLDTQTMAPIASPPSPRFFVGPRITSIALDDLDSDGDDEILVTTAKQFAAYNRDGTLFFSSPSTFSYTEARSIVVGDFIGNGNKYIAHVSDTDGGVLSLYTAGGCKVGQWNVGTINELIPDNGHILALSSLGHVFSFSFYDSNGTLILAADRVSEPLYFTPTTAVATRYSSGAVKDLYVAGEYYSVAHRIVHLQASDLTIADSITPSSPPPAITSLQFGSSTNELIVNHAYNHRAYNISSVPATEGSAVATQVVATETGTSPGRIELTLGRSFTSYFPSTPITRDTFLNVSAQTTYPETTSPLKLVTAIWDDNLIKKFETLPVTIPTPTPTSTPSTYTDYQLFPPSVLDRITTPSTSFLPSDFAVYRTAAETTWGSLGISARCGVMIAAVNFDIIYSPTFDAKYGATYLDLTSGIYGTARRNLCEQPMTVAFPGTIPAYTPSVLLAPPLPTSTPTLGAVANEFIAFFMTGIDTTPVSSTVPRAAFASAGGTLYVVTPPSKTPLTVSNTLGFGPAVAMYESAVTSPPTQFIAVGTLTPGASGNTIYIFGPDGTVYASFHNHAVTGLKFITAASGNLYLVVGGADGSITIYDASANRVFEERIGSSFVGYGGSIDFISPYLILSHAGGWVVYTLGSNF